MSEVTEAVGYMCVTFVVCMFIVTVGVGSFIYNLATHAIDNTKTEQVKTP